MTRFIDRRLAASVVLAGALATAVMIIVKNEEPQLGAATGSADVPDAESRSRPLVAPLVPEQQRSLASVDPSAAAFLAQVEHKYRFLIADVEKAHVEELRRRLLERESQLDVGSRSRIDAGIGKLLPAQSFAYYQALKDSDFEQHRLAEYTGGISNVAPLDQRQERIVLDAKLRQKQRYAEAMRDVGLDRANLSDEARAYAHARTVEALKQYTDEFLTEVAPALSQEQYRRLKNYETTELNRELDRLQQRIDAE